MSLLGPVDLPWREDPASGRVPASFRLLQERFLHPAGCVVTDIEREPESAEYGAIRFRLGGQACVYRQAKHTPKKVGQFVTVWKRPTPSADIAPFDREDGIERVFVFADEQARFGVFVFPVQQLLEQAIFSERSEGGKRAFRVYAPWTEPEAAQARRSKKWQCRHFVELTDEEAGRLQLARLL